MSDSYRNLKCEEIFQMLREGWSDEIAALGLNAIPHLLAAVDTFDHDLQEAGKKALSMIRPGNPKFEDAETLIQDVVECFAKPNIFLKAEAAKAFAKIGVCAIPALLSKLKDENIENRRGAVKAIRWIAKTHPKDPKVIALTPTLIGLATGKDSTMMVESSQALREINDPAANERLFAIMMEDPCADVRAAARFAIATIGQPMIARLLQSIHDPDQSRCEIAQNALYEMAKRDKLGLPELRVYLRHMIEAEKRNGDESSLAEVKANALVLYLKCYKKSAETKSRMFDGEILDGSIRAPRGSRKDGMFRSAANERGAWSVGSLRARTRAG